MGLGFRVVSEAIPAFLRHLAQRGLQAGLGLLAAVATAF